MVIDHCHLTGKIRGWACEGCNLNYKLPNFVPIVFHNGSNYDFKMHISEIYNEADNETTNDCRNRRRRHSSWNQRHRRRQRRRHVRARNDLILDEAEDSQEEEEEEEEEEQMNHTSSHFNGELFKLARCKGIFPYEFIQSLSDYNVTELPSIEFVKIMENSKFSMEMAHVSVILMSINNL